MATKKQLKYEYKLHKKQKPAQKNLNVFFIQIRV